nr:hypothetical protein [Neorhizobium tomejilense]
MTTHTDEADLAYANSGGDLSLVPHGPYCYRITDIVEGTDARPPTIRTKLCPYWGRREAEGETFGYCAHLKSGDWEEDGPMFLFDQVKECGVNVDVNDAPSISTQ